MGRELDLLLRHRCIKNLHHGSDVGHLLHNVPQTPPAVPPAAPTASWAASPPGSSKRSKSSGSEEGTVVRKRPCNAPHVPPPEPLPSSGAVRCGADTRQGPSRRSSVHTVSKHGGVAPSSASRSQRNNGRGQHKSHPLRLETSRSHRQGNACLSQTPCCCC